MTSYVHDELNWPQFVGIPLHAPYDELCRTNRAVYALRSGPRAYLQSAASEVGEDPSGKKDKCRLALMLVPEFLGDRVPHERTRHGWHKNPQLGSYSRHDRLGCARKFPLADAFKFPSLLPLDDGPVLPLLVTGPGR